MKLLKVVSVLISLLVISSTIVVAKEDIQLGIISSSAKEIVEVEQLANPEFQVDATSIYRDFGEGFKSRGDIVEFAESREIPLFIAWQPVGDDCLSQILDNSSDQYIRTFLDDVGTYPGTVFLSFGPEMNGDWSCLYNNEVDFIRAYRQIHDLFKTNNVLWVWQTNIIYGANTDLEKYYPGDEYVDVIGIDGYNWGDPYTSFAEVFEPTLTYLTGRYSQDIYITETASPKAGGDKAQWIKGMFDSLENWTQVKGVNWFQFNKERDWRISEANVASVYGSRGENYQPSLVTPTVEPVATSDSTKNLIPQSWESRSDLVSFDAVTGFITFQTVPDTIVGNVQILTGADESDFIHAPPGKYSVSFEAVISTNPTGYCGVFIDYSIQDENGQWGQWIGDIRETATYTFVVPPGIDNIKVQFYCDSGTQWAPVIRNFFLKVED